RGADPAQADDAEGPTPQPVQGYRLSVAPGSAPAAQAGVQEVSSACQAQHKADGGVGHVFRAVIGDIDDGNSPFAGGAQSTLSMPTPHRTMSLHCCKRLMVSAP